MRILQICSARELGGGEKHLADLANALARRGHDVHAALIPASPLLGELSALPTQNILELAMRNSLNARSALKLVRFVRENQIEIIHAHVARDYPLAALVAARAGGVPVVLTRHVLFPLKKVHRLTLRRVARVIAVSQAVADGLRGQRIFDERKIVVIHNGIDLEKFSREGNDRVAAQAKARGNQNRLQVGAIGHIAPIKGHDDFIRAAAIVNSQRDDVDFIIAGEDKSRTGDHRRQIEELIDDLGLGERVRLSGWVNDVAQLLSTLDLFVSSARSEPFGLAIVEAMAAGVPVVATRSEGAREIIDADTTGKLVPIGDVEALAKAICELLADPTERANLSANARRAVSERFSLEQMVDATEQLYRQVLSESATTA
ncbi:MAG TPA: glycosyltransferase family 4 protein [Pyrinomonadaceae bacterium]|nr:glycosyltransferase family 4 protein [Pyrinomonadaceae bacterium]